MVDSTTQSSAASIPSPSSFSDLIPPITTPKQQEFIFELCTPAQFPSITTQSTSKGGQMKSNRAKPAKAKLQVQKAHPYHHGTPNKKGKDRFVSTTSYGKRGLVSRSEPRSSSPIRMIAHIVGRQILRDPNSTSVLTCMSRPTSRNLFLQLAVDTFWPTKKKRRWSERPYHPRCAHDAATSSLGET